MTKGASEQEIRHALAEVRHPEIARTLVDLGMLKDITVKSNKVALTLALPLMGIPTQVRDYLINSLRQVLAVYGEILNRVVRHQAGSNKTHQAGNSPAVSSGTK